VQFSILVSQYLQLIEQSKQLSPCYTVSKIGHEFIHWLLYSKKLVEQAVQLSEVKMHSEQLVLHG